MKEKNICIIVCMVLFLGVACESPVSHDNGGSWKNNNHGTVHLTIKGIFSDSPARTILPDDPEFSSYRLSFAALDNQESKPDMEIPVSSGETTIHAIDLEPGNWNITVYGRITINDTEKEVAQGTSDPLYVIAGENISTTVTLRSKIPDAGKGVFSWSITVPQGIPAEAYTLILSEWDNENNKAIDLQGDIDTESNDVVITGSEEIDAGYYLLQVAIGDDKQRALFVDIVHVLNDRTSRFEDTVSASDFVPVIHLSGTVRLDVTIDKRPGPQPNITEIWAYYSGTNETVGRAAVTNAAWEMSLVAMPQETDLDFRILCTIPGSDVFEVDMNRVQPVYQSDISGIELQNTLALIVLSGTLVPKGITSPARWEIRAYTEGITESIMATPAQSDANGRWNKLVKAVYVEDITKVYFSIQDPTGLYQRTNLKPDTDTDLSNITITGYFTPPEAIKISGTLPGMAGLDNWTNPNLGLRKGGSQFTYTYAHNELSYARYEIQFLANFDLQGNPSWDETSASIIAYNYERVEPGADPERLDFEPGTNGAIMFNYILQFTKKTLKFTLDFSGNTYFSTGKPALRIERRSEVRIPAGSFTMGSPDGEQGRNGPSGLSSEIRHEVQLTHDYWMMETEVSQKDYQKLVPAYTNHDCANDTYPVVYISWLDAVAFANKLSEKDGLNPVYTIGGNGITPNWNANGWRLPTEAEWEYAARGGTTTPFGIGNGTTLHTDIANYNGSTVDAYNPVAGNYRGHIVDVYADYPANRFGLYNMHGNAWEFCWDYYADYIISQKNDPHGYDTPGGGWENERGNGNDGKAGTDDKGLRIIRGGSYFCSPRYLRSAHRGTLDQTDNRNNDIGFRLVRRVE